MQPQLVCIPREGVPIVEAKVPPLHLERDDRAIIRREIARGRIDRDAVQPKQLFNLLLQRAFRQTAKRLQGARAQLLIGCEDGADTPPWGREELKWAAVEREFDNGRDVGDERTRPQEPKDRQEFHVGIRSARHTRFAVHRPRELTHDAQVYRAYVRRFAW